MKFKEIKKQLIRIMSSNERLLPRNAKSRLTDCSQCGAIMLADKLAEGPIAIYYEGEYTGRTMTLGMCENCSYRCKHEQMVRDEQHRIKQKLRGEQ
jgi:hypothetical protein